MPEPVAHRTCEACGTEWETPQSYAPSTPPQVTGEVRQTDLFQNFPSQARKRSRREFRALQAHVAKVLELSKCPHCGLSVYEALPRRPDETN